MHNYSEYTVYNSEDSFGIFTIDSNDYPDIVKQNPQNISYVNGDDIENFLIENIGRNNLVKQEINNKLMIGFLYSKI